MSGALSENSVTMVEYLYQFLRFLIFTVIRFAPIKAIAIKEPGVTMAATNNADTFNLCFRLLLFDISLFSTGYLKAPQDGQRGVLFFPSSSTPQKEHLDIGFIKIKLNIFILAENHKMEYGNPNDKVCLKMNPSTLLSLLEKASVRILC